MIKLLTSKEVFEGCTNVYTPDYESFYTVGEPKGEMKQVHFAMDFESYLMFEQALKVLGLKDYIQTCYDNGEIQMIINMEVAAND